MKNFAKIFTAIVVAFAAYSCIADATEDLGVQVGNGEVETTITLSFEEQSKVQLGEKAGEVYPLYWSEGDAIAVNGVASNELTGVGENVKEAQFIVEGVSYPLNIVYPAPTVTEAEVTEEGEAVAGYPVVFPAVQQYVPGNVDPKAVVLYGYTAAEPTAPVQLNHLTGVLQINVKGAVTLTQLTVNARGGNIAGTYNVDCATGTLTAVNASNTVTMTFGDGLALGAEATPIYVAVPAGSHGAVWVTLHTATDKMTIKFDSANKPVSAGKVREFKEFEYAPNTKDEESEEFVIDSVDKLIEFANKVASNKFFPLTKAVVTADLTWPADQTWTPIENFGAFEFDGGEHTITGLTAPLFGTTNADIHHLTLADVALNITDNGNSGAFARRIIGGSLRHCSATGTSTIDCAAYDSPDKTNSYFVYAHGGLVGYVNATVIDNCTNNINITIVNNYAGGEEGNTKYKSAIGGIAGSYSDLSSFTNLINNGSITYTGTTQKGTMYISGIVGRDVEGGATTTVQAAAFDNCTNNGNITHTGSSTGGVNLSGIVGFVPAADLTCTNLVNNGQVLCKGATTAAFVAGICANSFGANMKDCKNTNSVGIGSGTKNVGAAYIAGIAAYGITTNKTMDNCDNSGKVVINIGTIALGEDKVACLAGIIGIIRGNKCVVKNCDNSGQVSQKVNAANAVATCGSFIGGICAHITGDGSSIQNCNNSGKIQQEEISGASEHTSTLAIGGILGMNADKTPCTISGCENRGVVVNDAAKPGSQNVGTGGIVGILGCYGVVTGCTNRAIVGGKSDSGSFFGMGGVVGMTLRGGAKILSCTNYGEIQQNDTSLKKGNSTKLLSVGYGIGGVVGMARSTQEISDCVNHGTFVIKNTNYGSKSETHFYVGGVIGWYFHQNASDPEDTAAKTVKNCTNYANLTFTGRMGWYYAGGVIGALMTYESDLHYWAEISGLKNYGDLNFNPTASAGSNPQHGFGGVIGYTTLSVDSHVNHDGKECIALNGCEFYGNITTNGLDHVTNNLGIIMGCERVAELHVAKNSKIGGWIDATVETETIPGEGYIDPDTEEWVETTPATTVNKYVGGTALSAENIHEHLYSVGIDASVATTDGYTILTERPAVPAVPEA